ncbi:MAG: phosphoribosylaminoimidazolesuccinocarboxamide synthase [Candidatus Bathyarchaeia archaeon]|jgi:phosphoribosylaminoimidazole-succinocarboxamide synthase
MSLSIFSSGKTKTVTPAEEPGYVVLTFRDDITAGDGKKHEVLPGKGKVNAAITARLYSLFTEYGIPNHFIKQLDDVSLLVKKLDMIPVEVVCRIRAAGHFIGIGKYFKNGEKLSFPTVEFYLKDDSLHDPMLTDQHLKLLKLASDEEIEGVKRNTQKAAAMLEQFFDKRAAILVDFKLEFGRDAAGQLMIGDELSPDSWRLWDKTTKEILDKDRFRKDLPEVFELGYAEPLRRVCGGPNVLR